MKMVVIGAGDIGSAAAEGIRQAGIVDGRIILTRKSSLFSQMERKLFHCSYGNKRAVVNSDIVVIAVQPKDADTVLEEIKKTLSTKKILISIVSGLEIEHIQQVVGNIPIVRAMPNIAIKVGQSMTCLACNDMGKEHIALIEEIFNAVGLTLFISEEKFPEATVLCGSGTALALKFIRAFMQAGIQSGFNKKDSFLLANQVLRGAAELAQQTGKHPEALIDEVTTPDGCTIAALAEMEHRGFCSAFLSAVKVGIKRARELYQKK